MINLKDSIVLSYNDIKIAEYVIVKASQFKTPMKVPKVSINIVPFTYSFDCEKIIYEAKTKFTLGGFAEVSIDYYNKIQE